MGHWYFQTHSPQSSVLTEQYGTSLSVFGLSYCFLHPRGCLHRVSLVTRELLGIFKRKSLGNGRGVWETRSFFTSDSLVLSEFLYGVRLFLCFLCNFCMLRNEVILTALTFSGSLVYNKHGGFFFFHLAANHDLFTHSWCAGKQKLHSQGGKGVSYCTFLCHWGGNLRGTASLLLT